MSRYLTKTVCISKVESNCSYSQEMISQRILTLNPYSSTNNQPLDSNCAPETPNLYFLA